MLDGSCCEGLDGAGRRRLWLLEILIEKVEPNVALDLAIKMDAFVRDGHPVMAGTQERTVRPAALPPRPSSVTTPIATADYPAEMEAPKVPAPRTEGSGSRLLDAKTRQDFTEALAGGADNGELARRFGMTPRQANGLRMGIQKQFPHLGTKKVAKRKTPEIDRSTELQMQEAFLSTKRHAASTLDDVVRFLRQRGDVVVRSAEDFVVDGHRRMTPAELVARANAKRSELRLPAFSDVWSVTEVAPQAAVGRDVSSCKALADAPSATVP